ncbi:ANTAR domain-containing protein [Mycolicibacterium bacteremicum]|uniref:ANTAR domain-containing protein n=1 Tax=Mycolicibacterium bacteremicum TaxID=564198 RepID=A0A1W9YZ06_MYCBA|nr:GAF and ANTAR domain-containing protein [Mycolicibacterium bacteremicum]MCV7435063.1 GAF and ANTAR domain-containing protein [Mycolicibacterium bacteremicum]ORA05306.1 hypothetical protein BST17_08775 [Mycolicibacterium bacteremicum]
MDDRSVPEWVELLNELAGDLRHQRNTQATLNAIIAGAVDLIPGASWAGVSVVTDGEVQIEAATDPVVTTLDRLQVSQGDGPFAQALHRHRSVHVADMTADSRWPALGRAAADLGAHSALWFRLFFQAGRLAVLTIYGAESHAFAADSLVIGDVLAQHAASALIGAEAADQFNQALASRDVIGQAKGLLMQQRQLSGLQAFELMIRTSQDANIKLVDIARWVVAEHENALESDTQSRG